MQILTSPTKSQIRVVEQGVVLADLGPAMARTTTFANRVLKNNPSLQTIARKARVGKQTGWVLNEAAFMKFMECMDGARSKSDEGDRTLNAFMKWAPKNLLPVLRQKNPNAGKGNLQPSRVIIDFKNLQITVEMSNGLSTSVALGQ